jgi:FkbM family methyltransferase
VVEQTLIFDIGLHTGRDANFYLRKGFRVVGVEAREDLSRRAAELNAPFADRFTIVQRALHEVDDAVVPFFINDEKDDWGSLDQSAAEKGNGTSRRVEVRTVTLRRLFEQHGVPYYAKCDIEGGDRIFAESLQRIGLLPKYVSIELTRLEDVAHLYVAGYRRFQVVNQFLNPFTVPPRPAREGAYVDATFDGESSGLFGKELPEDQWISFPRVSRLVLDWMRLRDRAPQLAPGWVDVHAVRPGPPRAVNRR